MPLKTGLQPTCIYFLFFKLCIFQRGNSHTLTPDAHTKQAFRELCTPERLMRPIDVPPADRHESEELTSPVDVTCIDTAMGTYLVNSAQMMIDFFFFF